MDEQFNAKSFQELHKQATTMDYDSKRDEDSSSIQESQSSRKSLTNNR